MLSRIIRIFHLFYLAGIVQPVDMFWLVSLLKPMSTQAIDVTVLHSLYIHKAVHSQLKLCSGGVAVTEDITATEQSCSCLQAA